MNFSFHELEKRSDDSRQQTDDSQTTRNTEQTETDRQTHEPGNSLIHSGEHTHTSKPLANPTSVNQPQHTNSKPKPTPKQPTDPYPRANTNSLHPYRCRLVPHHVRLVRVERVRVDEGLALARRCAVAQCGRGHSNVGNPAQAVTSECRGRLKVGPRRPY